MRNPALLLLLFLLMSCNKDKTTSPETSDYFAVPQPYINKGDQQATLFLFEVLGGDYRIPPKKADFIEIYYSSDSTSLKLFKKVGANQTELAIPNLKNGIPYYFSIKSYSGKQSVVSDTVMTIPGVNPQIELYASGFSSGLPVSGLLISPDGKLLYYRQNDESYIKNLTSGLVTKLIAKSSAIAWANHSHKLLITYNSFYSIELYDADNHTESEVMAMPFQYVNGGFTFTDDDKYLYFSSSEGNINSSKMDIWKISLDTKLKTRISNFSSDQFPIQGKLTISSDEKSIYFTASTKVPIEERVPKTIYKYTLDSKILEPIALAKWHEESPSLSPDGKHLAFTSYRAGLNELWMINTSTNELTQLTNMSEFRLSSYSNFTWSDNNEIYVAMVPKNMADYGDRFYKFKF